MTIHVTPIPRLIDLAAPAFTLGTANAAGPAATAVASDATLLAFDTTDPAAVAASAVVGSATVAARRDHVHPGTTGAGTVVDDAITRFNGTGGSSLQGYSSLSPTISDAGIISLTSGALKFPATEITSSDANTLDDYQEGTFTPTITNIAADETMSTSTAVGYYTKIGNLVTIHCRVVINGAGTVSGGSTVVVLGGLPFTADDRSGAETGLTVGFAAALNLGTAGFSLVGVTQSGGAFAYLKDWSSTAGLVNITRDELSLDATLNINGTYEVA
jgi:hypothetical protein